MAREKAKVGTHLTMRLDKLGPVVERWRRAHPGTSLSWLLRTALKRELRPYAGKRYKHLVEE